jgi:hypothetical protein
MTTSAPLESIAVDTTRRDQWGRYLVVPPTGGKPIGYTRVTTVAKALDNGGGLANWKASQAICGTLIRRGLRAQWEALLAEHGGDPWYANKASKAACKRLVEECAAVGGANDRREMGSSLHTITALADLGSTPTHLSDETAQDLGAYQAGLASAGIKIDPSLIETTVVLDAFQVAGTFDRLAVVPGFDLPLVADLKTGADLSYSWPSISVQLAAYSRADHIYRQGIATDGSQDRRLPMPEVDQRYGLVMWLDAGSNKLELFLVELEPGWEAFEHSIWTRHWRSRRDIAFPLSDLSYDTEVTDRIALLEASIVKAKPEKSEVNPLRAWLSERIEAIGLHAEARITLGEHWPSDLPTLRSSPAHSPEQLAVIEKLCDDVERAYRMDFPGERPGLDLFPNPTITKESAS